MAAAVKAIPDGFNTVSVHMCVKDAAKAIDFYKKAFGAEEIMRMPGPDGKGVMHAELKIGNSIVMVNDEFPGPGCKSPATLNGSSSAIHLYVPDADTLFARAVDAGAEVTMPIMDAFWGDRFGQVKDPFGHQWSVATHTKDLTPDEIAKGAEEFFKNMGSCHQ